MAEEKLKDPNKFKVKNKNKFTEWRNYQNKILGCQNIDRRGSDQGQNQIFIS